MSLVRADARALPLTAGSVQCVVTSPPYWGLRDYGTAGQLGLEATPDAYVAGMVAVFRQVWRVLREDGVLFLNLGDSYAANAATAQGKRGFESERGSSTPTLNTLHQGRIAYRGGGIKAKDLIGIPWRVAFALQADGWYLRSDIIWAKPNPMPESVTDRPTKSHEYVFLLTKAERYYWNADAIAEPTTYPTGAGNVRAYEVPGQRPGANANLGGSLHKIGPRETRNVRSVWTITTQPYAGAHFATMPEALAERCILAGSRTGDRVLDPFAGSGTVARCAISLGRRGVGVDLSAAYLDLARERITVTRGLPFDEVSA